MARPYPHSLRVLFYADLHVGDRSNGRRYTDMLEAEERITDLAVERKVDWIIFGGDAFKSRNPHDEHKTTWLEARSLRSRGCESYGIHEFDLIGNHCRWFKADESGHVFEALRLCSPDFDSHIHVIQDKCDTVHTTDERVLFHCLPAQTTYTDGVWKPDPSKINLCIFHGMVKGCSLNQEGTVKADHGIPIEILDRPDFDFVLCGDIHLPSMLDFQHTVGGYVGSTLQLDATDVGEKRGVLIVTFLQGATEPQVEFVPIPQAELVVLKWDASQPLPSLDALRGHLVTLKITNASALSSIELDSRIDQIRSVVRHLTISIESSDFGHVQAGGSENFVDPVDDFVAYMNKIPDIDPSRGARIIDILRKEIYNGEGC